MKIAACVMTGLALVVGASLALGGCAGEAPMTSDGDRPPTGAKNGEAPTAANGGTPIAGREFLLPGQKESTAPQPYGLYSYLLFGAEPSATTRPRLLAVIQTFIEMLPPVRELERAGAERKSLNAVYVPVTSLAAVRAVEARAPEAATLVLRDYDYARARVLLAKVPRGPHLDGPYFVSYRSPLSDVDRLTVDYGWVDITTVPASRVDRWVRIFLRETARQNYWEPDRPLRVWTTMVDALEQAGEGAPEVLRAIAFWIPSR